MPDQEARLTAALADRYRIERELGQGGMATVYLAHDLKHEREVAIKVLHPDLGAALGADRFLSEIKTTAKLSHPHILPLLDSGAADGFLFYVMPYVTGETLRDRLQRETQLPVADALRITREVADALAEAHQRGIVHRDIKPENILLQGAHALVADFGIALAVQQASGPRMTQTGLSLGTPQYMSPEQAMGDKNVDHRADIYALGAVAYEMLTGEPPHTGANPQAIVAKLLSEPVRPVTVLRPAVPVHVDAAIHVALQKLAADRFATVAEFSEALRSATGAHASSALLTAAMPSSAGKRRGVLVGAIALTGVALAAGWAIGRAGRTDAAQGVPLSVRLALPFASEATLAGPGITLSRDGTLLALAAPDSFAPSRLFVHALTDQRTVGIENDAISGAFTPDGRSLAYISNAGANIMLVPVDGGSSRVLTQIRGTRGMTWADDSTLVFAPAARGLRRTIVGRAGYDTLPGSLADSLLYFYPHAIAPGRLLVSAGPSIESAEVGLFSMSGGAFRSLGVRGVRAMYVEPGLVLFLDQGTVWGFEVDPRTFARRSEPRAVVDGRSGGRVVNYAVSRNGVLVVRRSTVGAGRRLVVRDRAGLERDVRAERALYRSVRFSPGGERIAYSVALRASAGGDIFVANVRDGNTIRFTSDSNYLAPEWSRDGSKLMYATRLAGTETARILSVDASGGGAVDTLISRPNGIFEFELTPDGQRVLWREDAGANARDVLSAAPRTAEVRPERATRFDERGIALSPDGAWYLYTSNETGRAEVYLSRFGGDGARWPVSRGGGTEPRWARNGEAFYRASDSIFVTRIATGAVPRIDPPRALFADGALYYGYEAVWDVSADGRQFVFVRVADEGESAIELRVNWIGRWRAGVR